jgi:hypothetical protein
MRRSRFRIGSLLILVVLLGVGFAALKEAGDLWDSAVLSSTIGVLMISVLLAAAREGASRAFWVGFALFGWGYLVLTAIPSIEPRLPTTRALAYLDSLVPGRYSNTWETNGRFSYPKLLITDGTSAMSLVREWGGTSENFVRIGHSLFALILANLGGLLSRYLHLSGARNGVRSRTLLDDRHPLLRRERIASRVNSSESQEHGRPIAFTRRATGSPGHFPRL